MNFQHSSDDVSLVYRCTEVHIACVLLEGVQEYCDTRMHAGMAGKAIGCLFVPMCVIVAIKRGIRAEREVLMSTQLSCLLCLRGVTELLA